MLQINTIVNSGSTGRIVEEIGMLAKSLGWDSYIAYGRNPRDSSSNLLRIGSNFDVYRHVLQTRIFDSHGLSSKKATKRFLTQVEELNPDIIHLHNIHGYYINYDLLFNFLREKSIPVVWTLHDCWSYTGHCPYYTYVNCSLWKKECMYCPLKKQYPASLFFDRCNSNFLKKKRIFTSLENLTIVTVSDWLKEEISNSFLNKYPIKRIYNGLDTEVFTPRSNAKLNYGFNNKFVILGVASIWDQRKGLSDFIRLSSLLRNDEIIVLIGLKKKQISLLPPNIIGIERTENREELVALYSRADLYINFSIEETFGLTTAESLSCGTPALVYNSTACPEVLSTDTGFIVEPGNLNEVCNIIKYLKNNSQRDYVESCRSRVLKMFNKNERWMDYIKLYNDLIR